MADRELGDRRHEQFGIILARDLRSEEGPGPFGGVEEVMLHGQLCQFGLFVVGRHPGIVLQAEQAARIGIDNHFALRRHGDAANFGGHHFRPVFGIEEREDGPFALAIARQAIGGRSEPQVVVLHGEIGLAIREQVEIVLRKIGQLVAVEFIDKKTVEVHLAVGSEGDRPDVADEFAGGALVPGRPFEPVEAMQARVRTDPEAVFLIEFQKIEAILGIVGFEFLRQSDLFPIVARPTGDLDVVGADPGRARLIDGDGLDMAGGQIRVFYRPEFTAKVVFLQPGHAIIGGQPEVIAHIEVIVDLLRASEDLPFARLGRQGREADQESA